MPRAVAILPTYSEIATLEGIVLRLHAAVPDLAILVVDDNSPDGTGDWANNFAAGDDRLTVLHRTVKEGLGPAYVAGFRWALERGYGTIVEMDADGSHRVDQLPLLLEAVESGAALAIGSRWIPGGSIVNWPWYRQAISRIGTSYARIMLHSSLHDITSGFRAFSRSALESADVSTLSAAGYAFQIELAWRIERQGLPITEVPITFVEREFGRSKMTTRIVIEALSKVTSWGLRGLPKSPPAS